MKTVFCYLYQLPFLATFLFSSFFTTELCWGFKKPLHEFSGSDTLITKSSNLDSTTFFNQFYQTNFIGESSFAYKNIGALLADHIYSNDLILTGLESYYPFLNMKIIPDTSIAASYIKYLTGTKQEQIFCAGFNQRVFRNFMLFADYRNIISPGFYQNQSNKIKNYHVGLSYHSNNNKYKIKLNYNYAKITEAVNGGLIIDSSLERISNNQGNGLNINLPDAKVVLKKKYFGFDQFLTFGKTGVDSATINNHRFLKLNKIKQSTELEKIYYIYTSNTINNDFYNSIYIDSASTYDSLYFLKFLNSMTFQFLLGDQVQNKMGLDLKYGNEFVNYQLMNEKNDFLLNNISAKIYDQSDIVFVSVEGNYTFEQRLKSAYHIKLLAESKDVSIYKKINMKGFFSIEINNEYPTLISSKYYSNHFIWKNELENVSIKEVKGGISIAKDIVNICVSNKNIKKYVFYNNNALPVQLQDDINIISSKIIINYKFYKNWHFYNQSLFQFSDRQNIYAVPDFTTYLSFYYEKYFFKNAMKASFGMGCYYFTSFYADAFMPATSQFYRQELVKIGNYPFVDLFVNFKIKTASFFIKIEHLNSGISGADYFFLPHLPTPGRTLKVGVDWILPEVSRK